MIISPEVSAAERSACSVAAPGAVAAASEPLQRFDYSPLRTGDSGFLIHCNFKRCAGLRPCACTASIPVPAAGSRRRAPSEG